MAEAITTGATPVVPVDPKGNPIVDSSDSMMKVKSVQRKFRDSFSGATLDTSKWTDSLGAGGAITVSGGQLTLASGTTANAETSVTSLETFTIPFRLSIGLTLSQRIANQSFYAEFISVDPDTGVPDGKHCASLLFDGTTVTQAKYDVQNGGLARLTSAAQTFPTTASGGLYEIEPFADETWFHGGTLDASSGRANSYRRHQQIPDPNAVYKVRLRWLNGATPPASSTNAVVNFIAVQDYAELTAEITAGRGQTAAGQGVGVSGTVTANEGSAATPTTNNLNSAATTNATSLKVSAGSLFTVAASNAGAAVRYLKLYNKSSAPVVGTDIPVLIIPIAAGDITVREFGRLGQRFSSGIALAITALMADTDATAIGAGEVKVCTSYV